LIHAAQKKPGVKTGTADTSLVICSACPSFFLHQV
jgi:hypothetical protein